MSERVLIVGGSGYVGQYICRDLPIYLGDRYEFYATYCNTNVFNEHKELFPKIKQSYKTDFETGEKEIFEAIDRVKPTFVINPSAMSAVVQCQNNPDAAFRVNDPSWWASHAMLNGCKRFIHISTDMVYKGDNPPYSEDSISEPLKSMIYGVSKKKGEDNLLKTIPATILRSALVIGRPSVSGSGRGSCLDWVISSLNKSSPENQCKFFDNEERSPLLVDDMVRVIAGIITSHDRLESPLLLNVGGETQCSRYDIGNAVAQRLGIPSTHYIPSKQEPIAAGIERPLHIQMSIEKLKQKLGIQMCTLDQSMDFIFSLKPYPFNFNGSKE